MKSTQQNLIHSFGNAFRGWFFLFTSERNAKIELLATCITLGFAFYFPTSAVEWCIILMCIGSVLAAEAFNTCIELLVDAIWKNHDKTAGKIKDISAGATLFVSLASAVIAMLIFIPKFFSVP